MSGVSLTDIQDWIANCDAEEALEPFDPRYVDLETVEMGAAPARMHPPF